MIRNTSMAERSLGEIHGKGMSALSAQRGLGVLVSMIFRAPCRIQGYRLSLMKSTGKMPHGSSEIYTKFGAPQCNCSVLKCVSAQWRRKDLLGDHFAEHFYQRLVSMPKTYFCRGGSKSIHDNQSAVRYHSRLSWKIECLSNFKRQMQPPRVRKLAYPPPPIPMLIHVWFFLIMWQCFGSWIVKFMQDNSDRITYNTCVVKHHLTRGFNSLSMKWYSKVLL